MGPGAGPGQDAEWHKMGEKRLGQWEKSTNGIKLIRITMIINFHITLGNIPKVQVRDLRSGFNWKLNLNLL